ncbi:alpha/beta fold hydrolase [Allokutzneria albata]|uniref:Pimeloyl-ACP methyl ester carboxylesterase n=1 Tax=Allokutzneria albata TaxID=211114 RepID=A0A1G9TNP6_ALLAB|nr:alpha/beta hydrolase [Allokutzneria albata]SDM49377.1 Pimeloyl-ACP methyl ester carboxylesterase [Allokutzneria albata]
MGDFLSRYDAVLARWPVPVEPVDVESEFGTTRVQVCGPPDGTPLVLLHGGGATSTVWFDTVGALAITHRVHAPDQIGEPGRSIHNGRPMRTVEDQLDWLNSVVDHFGLATFRLGGHSSGAAIAYNYAVRSPGRVDRLVLLDPTQCFAGLRVGYLLRAIPGLLKPTPARLRSFLTWETGGDVDPEWLELAAAGAEFPSSKTVAARRPKVNRLDVPTLVVIAGDSRCHDPDKVADNAGKVLSTSVIALLGGVTHHMLPMRPAERVNPILTEFLAR